MNQIRFFRPLVLVLIALLLAASVSGCRRKAAPGGKKGRPGVVTTPYIPLPTPVPPTPRPGQRTPTRPFPM